MRIAIIAEHRDSRPKTLIIETSFHAISASQSVTSTVEPSELVAALLLKGYEWISLEGWPGEYAEFLQASGTGVSLWVENDAKDLWFAYRQIEEFPSHDQQPFRHSVFLSGGSFQIEAECIDDQVQAKIIRCPGLRTENTSIHEATMPLQAYRNAWRSIARQLIAKT